MFELYRGANAAFFFFPNTMQLNDQDDVDQDDNQGWNNPCENTFKN
jgi:hypothetical protein